MGTGAPTALILGLLLGLKHATDADHVVAISTIVGEYRNPWRGIWVGASWGLGHTMPLLIFGIAILLLKEPAAELYEEFAPVLEFFVGVMLVFLGLQVFWNLRRRRIHAHEHAHEDDPHSHLHTHELSAQPGAHHGLFEFGRPFFRIKSFVIGIVHGMAGSAAVMLVVLATDEVTSFLVGVAYIVLFGVGTVLSMGVITLLMGIPFSVSSRFERFNQAIAGAAGTASVAFGVLLMYQVAVVEGL
jgi:ABC-type nickel/cobalt efflux system permease component RcnA